VFEIESKRKLLKDKLVDHQNRKRKKKEIKNKAELIQKIVFIPSERVGAHMPPQKSTEEFLGMTPQVNKLMGITPGIFKS
jgi:hypothetical protein